MSTSTPPNDPNNPTEEELRILSDPTVLLPFEPGGALEPTPPDADEREVWPSFLQPKQPPYSIPENFIQWKQPEEGFTSLDDNEL